MLTPQGRANIAAANRLRKGHPHKLPHTEEHRRKIGDAHRGKTISLKQRQNNSLRLKGRKQSPEHIAKRSAARRGIPQPWHAGNTYNLEWLTTFSKPATTLERALYQLLDESGLTYMPQRRIGRYVVDAFIPERGIAFEADGAYWHQDKEREARRDQYLLERGVIVVHLTDSDLEQVS